MLTFSGRQKGFTLTELMITIALSLTVISSVLVGYLGTYSGSMSTLNNSKLNQDLSALMNLMVSDIRRAGYTGAIAVGSNPTANAFNSVENTALEVFNDMTSNTQVAATGNGSCIVYAYDSDQDGIVDANELVGFRLNAGVVQMRTVGNIADPDTCASAGNTWTDLTDPGFITVTTLNFDLSGSACLNTREPDLIDNDGNGIIDNVEEMDCYDAPLPVAGSGNISVETRQVDITLTGNLTGNSFVRLSQSQSVRVRNDLVRIH
ncbi:MAG: prepilin-type N-terminal cleavage/methylation domain-containing protein [Gammaproteobacteria bacterium]|nr:prepilin-type N-terminal cleavage/methylation domain-containing protein [Gammaproteobacteria bacterium]MDP2139481.1 prepilin-type N-terminal cleavage/methylation domain-containing protein [Gammaproteobacteria bacterium]MDP2346318.1 prepilin-type N-terminal cleavage/methylation domain-containing protein [Gammaproteobacteria bacterium]